MLLPIGYYVRKGALKSFNMIEGGRGYLKNIGAITRGLKIIWDEKNNFSSISLSNLNYDWSLIGQRRLFTIPHPLLNHPFWVSFDPDIKSEELLWVGAFSTFVKCWYSVIISAMFFRLF